MNTYSLIGDAIVIDDIHKPTHDEYQHCAPTDDYP